MRDSGRARVVLAVLLLTAFTLITLDYRSGSGGPLRRIANAVFGPIENAVGDVARPVGSFFASLGHLSSYKSDNAKLRKEVAQLRTQLRLTDAERERLADEEKLLHLDQLAQFRIVAAHVSAVGGSLNFESTATIDIGSRDGITRDMTVIDGDGLVGKTLSVGPTTTTVLLANDVQFSAGARLESSQLIGHVDGGGHAPMKFTLLDSQGTIKVGQRLVTFGDIGQKPFVPEVPIGRVTRVVPTPGALTRTAEVTPYVGFDSLDVVGVVVSAPRTIKRDSLLPPSPSPSPTPSPTPRTPPATPPATPGTSPSPSPSASRTH
ncbi:MAG: rod shape-determining protein MreC [Frankiaceae bacterium]|jgi:rod shape-determining protein MreC|nr:rod shape-determining protein MreC [Frankiaceae bacterium]